MKNTCAFSSSLEEEKNVTSASLRSMQKDINIDNHSEVLTIPRYELNIEWNLISKYGNFK